VGELLYVVGGSQSSLSTHLSRLRKAGLVKGRKDGTRSFYALSDGDSGRVGLAAWKTIRDQLVHDGLLAADRERLAMVLAKRRHGNWADRVAGELHRQYIPGRTWESVAFCLAGLVDLGDVVDLGSGDGALSSLLAPQARRYLCVDLSARMVAAGQGRVTKAGVDGVRFVRGDMLHPPLSDGCADTVLLLQSLQYAQDPPGALRSAAALLRPGGRCVVLTLARHQDRSLRQDFGHVHDGFTTRDIDQWLLQAGLQPGEPAVAALEHRSPHLKTLLAIARK
jgi:ArsR family transcriptional regulator